ncbi:hypothetical protein M878_15190 [Streptomyces roseochromogenus subsp. oscitans DS 12.976]|uniref:Uncharacterized protein n=1 Tax=Streptomyces roseochromogenus subsp. oscitans DS 12.976 TaxID=1352936 RepID=V6KJS7_STRRC|nr:hypothetical protein M878_15190 [Streptomyces roseochromogenus subsp. oscitans DS 12.976]
MGTLTGGRAGGDAVTGDRGGAEVVRAVNGLTRHWAAAAHDGTVFSAAGVRPLPGFRTAAITTFVAAGAGALAKPRYATTRIDAACDRPFDRPFGFLALHRHARLVPAAGWVTDPPPYPEDPYLVTGKAAQEDDE